MKVAYTVSEKIAPYVHASILSLLEHNDVEKIYIFVESEDCKRALKVPDVCEVINVRNQRYFNKNGINVNEQFPWIARIRICMAKMLKNENLVLYLDADTIICDSLIPIWDTDMEGKWLAMVDEVNGQWHPYGPHYFNCGVMLMNLEQIRKDKIDDEWIHFFDNEYVWLGEQDTFNRFKFDKIVSLPFRYNEFPATGVSDNPAIVHYATYPNWYKDETIPRVEYLNKYLKKRRKA